MSTKIKHFSIFGNPIKHTLSPKIHSLFSKQTNIPCIYTSVKTPINKFTSKVNFFFNTIGDGANITLPFKEQAYHISDLLTNRAKLAKSVNTLKKTKNKKILGDNTDGIGLLYDLNRLNFLKNNSVILLIGAGGAAKGVLPFISSKNRKIFIFNRTFIRAKKLENEFNYLGNINAISFKDLLHVKVDLIINATSSFMKGEKLILPSLLIHKDIYCYDMSYTKNSTITPFLNWCKELGVIHFSDGKGMLVSQAAYSFLLWNDVLPDIDSVLLKI
ncbi:shikimate dehydrogenase [Buchnera aphidicola]|uniref:shikimate dehydrogenase n=1 Tax=Buchnera aphidicola TaxID=9 RepID=UPI0031B6FB79